MPHRPTTAGPKYEQQTTFAKNSKTRMATESSAQTGEAPFADTQTYQQQFSNRCHTLQRQQFSNRLTHRPSTALLQSLLPRRTPARQNHLSAQTAKQERSNQHRRALQPHDLPRLHTVLLGILPMFPVSRKAFNPPPPPSTHLQVPVILDELVLVTELGRIYQVEESPQLLK